MLTGRGGPTLSLFLPPKSFFLLHHVALEYFEDGDSRGPESLGEAE